MYAGYGQPDDLPDEKRAAGSGWFLELEFRLRSFATSCRLDSEKMSAELMRKWRLRFQKHRERHGVGSAQSRGVVFLEGNPMHGL